MRTQFLFLSSYIISSSPVTLKSRKHSIHELMNYRHPTVRNMLRSKLHHAIILQINVSGVTLSLHARERAMLFPVVISEALQCRAWLVRAFSYSLIRVAVYSSLYSLRKISRVSSYIFCRITRLLLVTEKFV